MQIFLTLKFRFAKYLKCPSLITVIHICKHAYIGPSLYYSHGDKEKD